MSEIETIGIEILQFVAADGKRLERFLSLTGLTPATLRQAASAPYFHRSLIVYMAQNESELLAFAEQSGRRPDAIMRHAADLPHGDIGA